MSKKTWIVWALFLLLPGLVGLCIHFALNDSIDNRIAESAEQNLQDTAVKEYLQTYEKWSGLPADQKADNPWGFGEYGGSDVQKRLREGQYDRLVSDLPDLEKGVTHYPDQLADVLYGHGWQQEIENYREERFVAEVVLIGSIFLLAVGSLILIAGTVKLLVLVIINHRSSDSGEEASADSEAPEQTKAVEAVAEAVEGIQSLLSEETASEGEIAPTEEALSDEDAPADEEQADSEEGQKNEGYFQSARKAAYDNSGAPDGSDSQPLPMQPDGFKSASPTAQKDSYFGWAIDAEDSTELENLMTTEPLTKELTELTEEVSAIRQFAAQQQDQVRKLQDGYDWMIIRRFCLRVIRCIDNIDDRVVNLREKGEDVSVYLEDIRDELIFALESSGIEQFKPDLNITFKGLEKYAEAVRQRIYTEDAELVGCIAEVTRPGYQYLVNDDDVKVVRCAQVKLYEAN